MNRDAITSIRLSLRPAHARVHAHLHLQPSRARLSR